eukprot:SAG11_NODE_6234_length_1356_cov_2.845664_2_plen_162_part_00
MIATPSFHSDFGTTAGRSYVTGRWPCKRLAQARHRQVPTQDRRGRPTSSSSCRSSGRRRKGATGRWSRSASERISKPGNRPSAVQACASLAAASGAQASVASKSASAPCGQVSSPAPAHPVCRTFERRLVGICFSFLSAVRTRKPPIRFAAGVLHWTGSGA